MVTVIVSKLSPSEHRQGGAKKGQAHRQACVMKTLHRRDDDYDLQEIKQQGGYRKKEQSREKVLKQVGRSEGDWSRATGLKGDIYCTRRGLRK